MEPTKKQILVPFDFSDYSFNAGLIGLLLAKQYKASVIFLNVTEYDFPTIPTTKFIDIEKRYKSLNYKEISDVRYSFVCKSGIPESEIIKYASQIDPFLVIMATRGKDRKKQDMIGSVTAEVMEKINQPLLVIPESSKNVDIAKITHINYAGFATGFSTPDVDLFRKMMDLLCIQPKVKVSLVHILEHKEKISDFESQIANISELISKYYPDSIFSTIIQAQSLKSIPEELNNIVVENKIDFLTVKSPRKNELKNFFITSLVEKMIYNASIPLLVL